MSKKLSQRTYEVIVPLLTLALGVVSGAVYGFAVANATWKQHMNNQTIDDMIGEFDDWR